MAKTCLFIIITYCTCVLFTAQSCEAVLSVCVCVRQMEGFHFVFNRLMACGKKLRNIKYDTFLKESGVKVKGSVNSH